MATADASDPALRAFHGSPATSDRTHRVSVLEGRIVAPGGVIEGRLEFDSEITAVTPQSVAPDVPWIVPGFVDCHVHGGGGGDVMAGASAVRTMAQFHATRGTTTLLATTRTAPADEITAAFVGIAEAMAEPAADAAEIAGVHLEGPFISPCKLGAQPPFTIPADPARLRDWAALAPIRVATVAPEIDPAGVLLDALRQLGAKAQIGHTTCSYGQALAALEAGYGGFTHLFNAMSELNHRQAGAAGCALAHASHAELILDFQHVEPGAALAALRAIPELYLITDATAAAGMPDGAYRLGRMATVKRGPAVRTADGKLAGSVLTMDQAFRNLLELGRPIEDAVRRCATIPAAYIGLADRGSLAAGLRADLVVCGQDMRLADVYIAGRRLPA